MFMTWNKINIAINLLTKIFGFSSIILLQIVSLAMIVQICYCFQEHMLSSSTSALLYSLSIEHHASVLNISLFRIFHAKVQHKSDIEFKSFKVCLGGIKAFL